MESEAAGALSRAVETRGTNLRVAENRRVIFLRQRNLYAPKAKIFVEIVESFEEVGETATHNLHQFAVSVFDHEQHKVAT